MSLRKRKNSADTDEDFTENSTERRWRRVSWLSDMNEEDIVFQRLSEDRAEEVFDPLKRMSDLRALLMQSANDLNAHIDDEDETDVKLFLQYQDLSEMPTILMTLFADRIHYLDINYNKFTNLNFLMNFPHLTTLICDHNPITTYVILPYLPMLKTAWFNNCQLTELFPFVSNLGSSCPNLEYLSLMGNPSMPDFYADGAMNLYKEFRLYVIAIFPKLKLFNDKAVYHAEKQLSSKYHPPSLSKKLASASSTFLDFWNRIASLFKIRAPAARRNTVV